MRRVSQGMVNLFRKHKNRFSQEFEQLILPLLDNLYRYAYRLTGQQANAEDLVQELVTRLHSKQVDLKSLENRNTWLLRALYNLFVDQHRQEKRHLRVIDSYADAGVELEHLSDHSATPEELAMQRAGQQQIEQALQTLNPEQRALIALHDIEGHTLQEIETITGTPLGTLKSRLHRARQSLREQLQEPFADIRRVNG